MKIPFHRKQGEKLVELSKGFPVVCLIGPRQSGKTTLSKATFPDHMYVSLENLDNRAYAETDPKAFLAEYNQNVIIDEAQHVPSLFSYIQTKVDETDQPGQYILTGSAQFQLLEKLSQSLAGRAAILKLLPLSLTELTKAGIDLKTYEEQLFAGFYPRLYKYNLSPLDWYPNYIQTYLEKDVREIINIKNLMTFKRFLKLCAGRHGQLLSISELANDCGIAHKTANDWLSVLEASFMIYLLAPYHKNFNKRIIKSPKLYFFDSGLVCSLLQIENAEQLKTHYARGAVFEGYVISELLKHRYNLGCESNIYFWREKNGHEIDCIIEKASNLLAIEIKSGKTISNDYFKGLDYWKTLTGQDYENNFLVYGGAKSHKRTKAKILTWKQISEIFE